MREKKTAHRPASASMTIIDRVVSFWNPKAGLERLQHRTMLANAQGGYNGTARRRRRGTQNWIPTEGSANADTLPDLPELRARSRDLLRNTPLATGAVATVVTNVVGDGLQLQASIDHDALRMTPEAADNCERNAEREWELF